jgi:hypothetical protein
MATQVLTSAGTLTAVRFARAPLSLTADIATVGQLIRDDLNVAHPLMYGMNGSCFTPTGILVLPNRGYELRVLPGDVVAVDSSGWPILISANSIAAGAWTLA